MQAIISGRPGSPGDKVVTVPPASIGLLYGNFYRAVYQCTLHRAVKSRLGRSRYFEGGHVERVSANRENKIKLNVVIGVVMKNRNRRN